MKDIEKIESIKEEIERLWEEIFHIRRETGRNPVLPQQRIVVEKMTKIACKGTEADFLWLRKMIIKVREAAFDTLLFYEGETKLAFPELENAIVLAVMIGERDLFERLISKYVKYLPLGNFLE
jgi:hypothetical protein